MPEQIAFAGLPFFRHRNDPVRHFADIDEVQRHSRRERKPAREKILNDLSRRCRCLILGAQRAAGAGDDDGQALAGGFQHGQFRQPFRTAIGFQGRHGTRKILFLHQSAAVR